MDSPHIRLPTCDSVVGRIRFKSRIVESASDRVVLDMDSSESPVHGQQEGSAYNGHFETVCYQPLFLFNGHGDRLAAKLRPGNVIRRPPVFTIRCCELVNKAHAREQLPGMVLDFRHDPARLRPTSRLIPEALIPDQRFMSWPSRSVALTTQ